MKRERNPGSIGEAVVYFNRVPGLSSGLRLLIWKYFIHIDMRIDFLKRIC